MRSRQQESMYIYIYIYIIIGIRKEDRRIRESIKGANKKEYKTSERN